MSRSTASIRVRTMALLVTVGALLASPAGGTGREPSDGVLRDDEIAQRLAAALDSLSGARAFSGAVLLARDGRTLLQGAYGDASREEHRANRSDTKFQLGSLDMIFTQVAILMLVEQGRLRFDDTIDRWVEGYPKEKGHKMTVQMLLEHRAGTGNVFEAPLSAAERKRLRTIPDYVRLIRDRGLEFEPGTRRAFSSTGYVLLGAVIEGVTGGTYYDYVSRHVFEPAGMTETGFYTRTEGVENRAVGYTRQGARLTPNTKILPERGSSAGGGYSTAPDLVRFVDALRSGKLLGEQQAMRYVGRAEGLGLTGAAPGADVALEILGPYTLAVLANLDPPSAQRVAARAREWLRRGAARSEETGPEAHARGSAAKGIALETALRTEIAPGGVSTPMTLTGHLATIEVMINGAGPYRFGLDTGSAGAARIDSALASKLGLRAVGEVWGGDPSGRNLTRLNVVAIDSLTIDGITRASGAIPVGVGRSRFLGLQASVRSPGEPGANDGLDGILGFGLFHRCLLTLDYPAERVRIEEDSLPSPNGEDVLACRDEDGVPTIPVLVDTVEVQAHVDAGSMGGFMLPNEVIDRLPLAEPPRVVGRARTVNHTFEIQAATLRGNVRVGGEVFENPTIEFASIFTYANIGSRVLRDYVLTFDLAHRRVRLKRGG